MKNVLLGVVLLVLTSAAPIEKFPVSAVIPTADITAQIKQDKLNNYVIVITANYLASVERLTPPKNTYVLWLVTKENGTANVGQFKNENAKKVTFQTLTPFEPLQLIITAEDEGKVTTPGTVEITRLALKNAQLNH